MKKRLSAMVLALVMALSMIPGAAAAGKNTVDIVNDRGTITVIPKYNDNVVTGQEMFLYKVGEPYVENNNLFFKLPTALEEMGLDLNGLNADENLEAAKQLLTKVNGLEATEKESILAGKKTTNEEGVKFEDVEVGVYLVVKTDTRYKMVPFLLYLPYTETTTDSETGNTTSIWQNELEMVVVKPKLSYTPPRDDPDPDPENPPIIIVPEDPPKDPADPGEPGEEIEDPEVPLAPLPQTGLLQWPIPLMAMAGALMFVFGFAADRKARKSED